MSHREPLLACAARISARQAELAEFLAAVTRAADSHERPSAEEALRLANAEYELFGDCETLAPLEYTYTGPVDPE
jgi:hypothetical protein